MERHPTKGRIAAGPDVKAIRAKTKLSQAKFADEPQVTEGLPALAGRHRA